MIYIRYDGLRTQRRVGKIRKKIFLYLLVATLKKPTRKYTQHTPKENSDLKGSGEPGCTKYRNRVETRFLYINTTRKNYLFEKKRRGKVCFIFKV